MGGGGGQRKSHSPVSHKQGVKVGSFKQRGGKRDGGGWDHLLSAVLNEERWRWVSRDRGVVKPGGQQHPRLMF